MLSARRQTASRAWLCDPFHAPVDQRVEFHPLPGQARPARQAPSLQALLKSRGSARTRLAAVKQHSSQIIYKKSIACTKLRKSWHAFRNEAVQRDFGSPACALQPTRLLIAWSRRSRPTCHSIRKRGWCQRNCWHRAMSGCTTGLRGRRRIRFGGYWCGSGAGAARRRRRSRERWMWRERVACGVRQAEGIGAGDRGSST